MASLTNDARTTAVATNDALVSAASMTNDVKEGRTLGSYNFDEIGDRTVESFGNLTFDSIYNPMTNDAKL